MRDPLKRKTDDLLDGERDREDPSRLRSANRLEGPIRAVFFDVDGVLLDSLGAHLEFCEDMNRECGLGLRIPPASAFKEMVRAGVRVSPMKMFFLAVGFSEEGAERADRAYQDKFAAKYQTPPFPGALDILTKLSGEGVPLGIVTANVRTNVERALGAAMTYFDSRCCFTKDDGRHLSKMEALRTGAEILGVQPPEIVYVGDQPADADAARRADAKFLGVTYGWGIGYNGNAFPTVDSPSELGEFILARMERTRLPSRSEPV